MSRLVTLLCLVALAVLPAAGGVGTGEDVAAASRLRPNMLIIVTDDQSRGTLTRAVMPKTFHALRQGGRRYARFFITDPLCCPSRAAIMTGRLNHNNGVFGNTVGSFHLNMDSTLQHYLHEAGYQTWISGKFLNAWSYDTAPPDWDRFAVTKGGRHVHLTFNQDGRQVYVRGQADPFIARQAHRYLAATEQQDDRRRRSWSGTSPTSSRGSRTARRRPAAG
jgi:arylsulfatase A-like enzyme